MDTETKTSTSKKRKRLGALLLAGSMIATACGSDTTDTATPTPTTEPAMEETMEETDEGAMDEGSMEEGGDMLTAYGPACGAVPTEGEGSFVGMADDPAATAASNNPLLSTLVGAVSQAGLVDTLNSEGPFTIFAPVNDAFDAIDPATLEMVLADNDLLTTILTYHVVAGESLDAEGLAAAGTLATVEGSELALSANGEAVNDVSVICSNVPTANATVHIIDQVLLPPAVIEALASGDTEAAAGVLEPTGPGCAAVPEDGEGSFVGMADDPAATAASNNPLLSTLVTAVGVAGLGDTLNSEGPFTIFAPVNDAFAAIPEEDLNGILADTDLLTSILTFHVVSGQLSSEDLVDAGSATTVNGADLTFADDGGTLTVNGANVICMDVPTANATVHIIDAVLVP